MEIGRIQLHVDFDGGVGGTQVIASDVQPSDERQRSSITEDEISSVGLVGSAGDTGRDIRLLAPGIRNCAKVSPAVLLEQGLDGSNVLRIRVDVSQHECSTWRSEEMIRGSRCHDFAGSCRLVGVPVATTVSIKIVNMQQVSSSAFPKRNELSSARLANSGKRISSGLELEECIVGESGRADSCKGLYPVGIRGEATRVRRWSLAKEVLNCCMVLIGQQCSWKHVRSAGLIAIPSLYFSKEVIFLLSITEIPLPTLGRAVGMSLLPPTVCGGPSEARGANDPSVRLARCGSAMLVCWLGIPLLLALVSMSSLLAICCFRRSLLYCAGAEALWAGPGWCSSPVLHSHCLMSRVLLSWASKLNFVYEPALPARWILPRCRRSLQSAACAP